MKRIFYLLFALLLASCGSNNNVQVASPDGTLVVDVVRGEDGVVRYGFTADGNRLINESRMGYVNVAGTMWDVVDVERRSNDGVWRPLWGKRAEVVDRYNEVTLSLHTDALDAFYEDVKIVVRVFDDGFAFKYVLPEGDYTDGMIEATQFNFADNYTAWFYNGERANIGPLKLKEVDGVQRPVMTIKCSDNQYMALHEADLQQGEPMQINTDYGNLNFAVADFFQKFEGPHESAWRVVLYGESAGEMVDSHLIELLNPDPSEDFSWVKPGVAMWDWRMDGAKVDGFTYSMSYPTWVRAIDFAAKSGFSHLILDANWYGPEFGTDSDPVKGGKADDVKRIIAYGAERGVGVWLYLNDVGGRQFPIEETLKQYGDWGAAGVKYGFMRGTNAEKVERTKLITRLCAENKLLVNFHDNPIHPTGQMRTYPNALTREYCAAQLDAHRVFVPSTFVTSVFVNMLAGPLDMNNGMFDLRQGHTDRVDESQPVPSTLASEGARTMIVFSGATVIPDIPEYYSRYPSLWRFLSAQQMPWVESKTLMGEIGEHIVMMRESDTHYLVGAAVNEQGATLDIPMSFLPKDVEFEVELTRDGDEAHYLTNRETIEVETLKVSATDSVRVKLAPGGGACLLIQK